MYTISWTDTYDVIHHSHTQSATTAYALQLHLLQQGHEAIVTKDASQ